MTRWDVGAWRHQTVEPLEGASCAEASDPELFFPQADYTLGRRGARDLRERVRDIRRAYCDSCPVTAECLTGALQRGDWGVWGGVYLPLNGQSRNRVLGELQLPTGT